MEKAIEQNKPIARKALTSPGKQIKARSWMWLYLFFFFNENHGGIAVRNSPGSWVVYLKP